MATLPRALVVDPPQRCDDVQVVSAGDGLSEAIGAAAAVVADTGVVGVQGQGLKDRQEYDLVRVRVDPMHHRSDAINEKLQRLERTCRAEGCVPDDPGTDGEATSEGAGGATPF